MSKSIIIVNEKYRESFNGLGADVLTPMEYILKYNTKDTKARVYNLASNMNYQEKGYYVSLLAAARRDKVFPSARCIQDLNDRRINKVISEDVSSMVQNKLKKLKASSFAMSVYFGKNLAQTYDSLAWELYRLVRAPMFRVFFENTGSSWEIKKISLLSLNAINEDHKNFVIEAARDFISQNKYSKAPNKNYQYDLAILHNEEERQAPSDPKALQKFVKAFEKKGFKVSLIQNKDKPDVNNYDALFIRETTNVTHHTYRMARSAEIERLVVIDDPDSIVRCTNKVFLEQLLERLDIPRPKSVILDEKRYKEQRGKIQFPCVIKQPDSAFSQGVHKASDQDELDRIVESLFEKTELLIIQEFVPTDFDWRIGILGGEVVYACKYFMARNHWQIYKTEEGKIDEGGFASVDPKLLDDRVVKVALKVAKEIGNGLYGVDLKQKGDEVYFIEINDNPSIESGVEDKHLGAALYDKIADHFLNECNKRRGYNVEKV